MVYYNIGKSVQFFVLVTILFIVLSCSFSDKSKWDNQIGLFFDYYSEGEYPQAEKIAIETMNFAEREFGKNSFELAFSYNILGMTYDKLNKLDEVELYFKKSISIYESFDQPDYRNTGNVYYMIGKYYLQKKHSFDNAKYYLLKSLGYRIKYLNHDDHNIGLSTFLLAETYYGLGDIKNAEQLYNQSIEIFSKTLPSDHPDITGAYEGIANVLITKNEFDSAKVLLDRALINDEKRFGKESNSVCKILLEQADLNLKLDNWKEAKGKYERIQKVFLKKLNPPFQWILRAKIGIATCFMNGGLLDSSEVLIEEYYQILEGNKNIPKNWSRSYLRNKADLRVKQNRLVEAEEFFMKAIDIDSSISTLSEAKIIRELCYLYVKDGRNKLAVKNYEKILPIYESNYGVSHPKIAILLKEFSQALRNDGSEELADKLEIRAEYILSGT